MRFILLTLLLVIGGYVVVKMISGPSASAPARNERTQAETDAAGVQARAAFNALLESGKAESPNLFAYGTLAPCRGSNTCIQIGAGRAWPHLRRTMRLDILKGMGEAWAVQCVTARLSPLPGICRIKMLSPAGRTIGTGNGNSETTLAD